ncbi:CLUMA_CG009885, isoform A, partial [Clunio marinus]
MATDEENFDDDHESVKEKFIIKDDNKSDETDDEKIDDENSTSQEESSKFFGSKKSFVLVYTLSAMLFNCGGSYTRGIISTLEKQYKLSSTSIGVMYALEDVISGILAIIIPYYTSKGHFPRWISFGLFLLSVSLVLQVVPYAIYGPGRDALALTEEYGSEFNGNLTWERIKRNKLKNLCFENKTTIEDCSDEVKNEYQFATTIIAIASSFAGCGQQFFSTLGTTYLDNNIKRSKIPLIYSAHRFVRLLAPAIGLNTASFFLKFYVAPHLHPTINNKDPRWIGAWWGGYIILAIASILLVPILAKFPRMLPRAVERKRTKGEQLLENVEKPSIQDLFDTIKRLLTNKTYFCNTMAAIFYVFGFIPYGYFMQKYLQIQFLLSPSFANAMTGSVSFVASAVGLLTAGIVITIFKPRARYLAGWNIVTSFISALGLIAFGFVGCPANNNAEILRNSLESARCNMDCHCDFVKYSPVCGIDGVTYISACHAGCHDDFKFKNGT